MPTPRIDAADRLAERIAAILKAAPDTAKATATVHDSAVASAARHGVALVTPPALTFPTAEEWSADWEVHLIAGPTGAMTQAWQKLDAMLDALEHSTLPITRATPATYQPATGGALSAYTLIIPS
ncbi:hypothetical protein [Leucobacter iarius]|uniref:Uncharacterized protein n=1 Tax=Leucobacter iarius TaxID=333963 RepID=A0ABN2LK13_9MICO